MSTTRDERRVVTFYSFKGGVGRTMTLANVAWRLAARHGHNVVVVDWDLEAPGLHEYFAVPSERAARTPGVLEFIRAWMDSVDQGGAELPDIAKWLVPVSGAFAPPNGSVSVLLAGRLDETYGERLSELDWGSFYQDITSKVALDTLRAQLLEVADVVLIDCRAGLTESSRACTTQLPDGVLLMTLPSAQSVSGIERVARALTGLGPRSDGRPPPTRWFVVCQLPEIDEGSLVQQWLDRWRDWFSAAERDGLWRWEDHHEGIATHRIPHRGRWTFGDTLVLEDPGAVAADPLSRAYDRLATTIYEWTQGDVHDFVIGRADPASILAELRTLVRDAERRGDAAGLSHALMGMALALRDYRRFDESIAAAERSSGIELGRGNLEEAASRMLFAAAGRRGAGASTAPA